MRIIKKFLLKFVLSSLRGDRALNSEPALSAATDGPRRAAMEGLGLCDEAMPLGWDAAAAAASASAPTAEPRRLGRRALPSYEVRSRPQWKTEQAAVPEEATLLGPPPPTGDQARLPSMPL